MTRVRLGEVATFVRGITFKPGDLVALKSADSIACMRTKNVQAELDLSDVWAVPRRFVPREDQVLRAGDVLVSSANSWNLVGKCAWVPDLPWASSFGGFVSVLRASSPKLDERYLYRWFSSPRVQTTLRSFGRQTTNISNLDLQRCAKLEVPLPPLSEQRRIAEVLDRAETLRAQRRQALAQLDAIAESMFLDMFGDPVSNPKGWHRKPMRAVGRVVTGNTPSRANAEYYGDAIEWIKSDNLNTPQDHATRATEYLSAQGRTVGRVAPAGSILVTCIAGSPECIGNAAIVEREVAFNQQINALVPAEGCLDFWFAQLTVGKRLVQAASTDGMKGMVSKSRFERVELIAPPQPLQELFAVRRKAVTQLKSLQASALAEADALFASLQHRAFRGEL